MFALHTAQTASYAPTTTVTLMCVLVGLAGLTYILSRSGYVDVA